MSQSAATTKRFPEDVVITFGKHKGKTLAEILADEPSYLDWLNSGDVGSLTNEQIQAVETMCLLYDAEIEAAVENAEFRRKGW